MTPKAITFGEAVHVEFILHVEKSERLCIEYWVHLVKGKGAASKKVFQIAEREFRAGESVAFRKKHRFQDFTTRKHYAGEHEIVIAVNGTAKATGIVRLKD